MRTENRRLAVVGSGVAGLVAAHVLSRTAAVTLYERDHRLGGHAHTHQVDLGVGHPVSVDSGFIVHNDTTYPVLCGLFDELGVATRDTEMSMSIRDDAHGVEFAGGKGLRGLLPTARHLTDPQHLRLLAEVPRFHRAARRHLDEGGEDLPLAEFVRREQLSDRVVQHFLLPLVAAVWSCPPGRVGEYPARYLFRFLANHGMLSVGRSLQWRTVVGGSAQYVEKIAAGIADVRTGAGVRSLRREASGVRILDDTGRAEQFDGAVVAVHPHQALALLGDPTPAQRALLSAIEYSPNPGLLHTDTSLLPRHENARGSWNYLATGDAGRVSVTYDLTRLMGLPTGGDRALVTLGGDELVDPSRVIAELDYEHPAFTTASVAAAQRLPELSDGVLAFAGAYHGWGFHEDGAASGLRAAERLTGARS
ncbi:NAD(P)/FAD-dependent oxidoreductase [Tsukamurella strandjordii]|uniref:FAD-dependent oxidoreductase n=1 Tax=Tsukamurella strandjordii TaxID=147577 RepID=A0AA90SGY6_9ACTN|nr:FAD-dependent oxidoreductase [Tsukamurella strandjordii]MDP0398229.1 FAD-dependent oxidoreductase [Tsukamurella strandjordii]